MARLSIRVVIALAVAMFATQIPVSAASPSSPGQPDLKPLSAEECSALKLPNNCQLIHTWSGSSSAPSGAATTATAAATIYYGYWVDEICPYVGGQSACWITGYKQTEDYTYDGSHVWESTHGCTPEGFESSITWCGYLYNGDGPPYYAMQFGLNGLSCLSTKIGVLCYNHGMRRWINDSGSPGSFSWW